MKSPFTGYEMVKTISVGKVDYKDIIGLEYQHHSYWCETTDQYFTDTELDTHNLNIIRITYKWIKSIS